MEEMTARIGKDWEEHHYYNDAEGWLDVFWGSDSPFLPLFDKLDCSRITELACGRGRHVNQYKARARGITLVDINQTNIDFCKKRFAQESNISYHVTGGNNFSVVEGGTQTAVFSYDAMVHFELLDIASYLRDTARVLAPGGMGLFHHSNYAANPGGFYKSNPHWRNFMSADIFAHLAARAGLRILSQTLISWDVGKPLVANIDCISLCQKV